MLKNFRDKIAVSGLAVLIIGVASLLFTFISAYGFLTQTLSIIASEDLAQTFGEALAPLIATSIRVMYLGVMGWIGSLLTIRGITIVVHAPEMQKAAPGKQTVATPAPQKAKTSRPSEQAKSPGTKAEQPKEEVKPSEPEVTVIPPEQVSQSQPLHNQQREKSSSQRSPDS